MSEKTVSDVIIEQLIQWGVKRIYAVAGDTILHFFDRLAHYSEIQLITTHHESAAAFMASAEAKLTGELAVCMGHNGPGVANLVNGLGDAYTDRCPVLVLTGQVERWNMGTNYKQYIHQQGLLQAVTHFSELIATPESTVDILTLAMRTAVTQGTVSHVVIPKDLFPMPTVDQPRGKDPYLATGPASPETLITTAVKRMQTAERPLILIGRGAIMAREPVLALAERLGAGMMATLPGRGIVPSSHPYHLGGLGHAGSEASTKALQQADLVIILGATWWPYDYVPKHIPILQIDANPANLGSSMPIEFGIVGKLEQIIPQLLTQWTGEPRKTWLEQIQRWKTEWEERLAEEAAQQTIPIQPQTIMATLHRVLPAQAIITLDVGDHVVWFNRSFAVKEQQILVSGRWRSMGFGLPAAGAAALVYPDRPVALITGDGGLSMVLAELSTLARYALPVKIFVLNNGSLGMEKHRMIVSKLVPHGVDLTNPDFTAIAQASGLAGYSVNEPGNLEEVLNQALHETGPTLVEIKTAETIPPHTKL